MDESRVQALVQEIIALPDPERGHLAHEVLPPAFRSHLLEGHEAPGAGCAGDIMASRRIWIALALFGVILAAPLVCRAQAPASTPSSLALESALAGTGTTTVSDDRWEVTLDGRIGVPTGHLKVGEFPTTAPKGGGSPGTRLRLSDLGIDMSEAIEGSVAFHVTPRDAVRASYLYYFLDGRTTLHHSVFYNGPEFTPGSLSTNADFYRLSLDYERTLLSRPSRERVIVSVGLTYVNFNPTLTGNNRSGGVSAEGSARSNSEDFYRQELPVPILGLRWDRPLGPRLLLRTSVSGGGLPRVDSLRKEGGTIYLQQSHADAGAGLAYSLSPLAQVEVGYHFTYFFQEEKSHEDKNTFELIDNGLQVGLRLRF